MALLGWLAGAPVLLLRWGGWPLSGAPGWEQFRRLPLPSAADQVIIGTLSVVLWGIWGQFAGGVAADVVAVARRREPRRRPDDPIRRFARHMVRSIAQAPSPLAQLVPPTAPTPEASPEVVPEAVPEVVAEADPEIGPKAAPQTVPEVVPEVAADRDREPAPTRAVGTAAPAMISMPVSAVPRLGDILGEVEVLVRVLGEVEAVRPGSSSTSADEQHLPVGGAPRQ